MYKAHHSRTTFGSWDVEKADAVVARSIFPSQNVQNTPASAHFWKLRCRKSARRCGAKHISKWKCTKHTSFGPLLDVEMSKKCMPLWPEAHFEVKMYKTHQVRTTFGRWDVEKVNTVVARSTFRSQNVQNTRGSDHFWRLFRCRKSARRCGAKHISKSKRAKHTSFGALLEVEMSKKCTPLWREAYFQVKAGKTHHSRTTFGSWDVEKVHAVVARSTCWSQNVQNTPASDHFWKLRCRKSARWHAVVARCTFRSQKCKKLMGTEHSFLTVKMSSCVAGARDCAHSQKCSKTWRLCGSSKTWAGVGHFKRICEDASRAAGAVQETCSSETLGGPGATFLARVALGSIRSLGLPRWFKVQHFVWPGITFSWQAQHFRQMEWKNRKTHWCEAVNSALNFPFSKEVSQNCFVSDVANLTNKGRFAGLLRFWWCQLR